MASLNILFLGDIVGEPGRRAVIELLPVIREREGIDFVIVNGENSANGRGITPRISIDLLRAGAAVITTGDHVWDQKEIITYIDTEPRLLRPLNYPAGAPGQGSVVLETAKGKVGVINVQGRTFTQPILENPFRAMEAEVARLREETPVIFVDIHAETTSEKGRHGPVPRRPGQRGRGHAYARPDRRRARVPRRDGVPVRRGVLRAGGFVPRAGRERHHQPFPDRTAGAVSHRARRGALHGAIVEIDPATGRARSIRRVAEVHESSVPPERRSARARPRRGGRSSRAGGVSFRSGKTPKLSFDTTAGSFSLPSLFRTTTGEKSRSIRMLVI